MENKQVSPFGSLCVTLCVTAPDKAETFAQVQAPCAGLRWEVGRLHHGDGKRGQQEWRSAGVHR